MFVATKIILVAAFANDTLRCDVTVTVSLLIAIASGYDILFAVV